MKWRFWQKTQASNNKVIYSHTVSDTLKAVHDYVEISAPVGYEELLKAAKKAVKEQK